MRRSSATLLLPLSLAAMAAATLLAPRPAQAYERQWHAGISLGYSYLKTDVSNHGIGGGLHLTYGLNDMFNLMVEADTAYHPSGHLLALNGSAGVSYVIDILQVVPYVGLMVGGYDLATVSAPCGGAKEPLCHSARLGASIPFGLDYTVNRNFNVGLAGRFHLLFLGPNAVDTMFTAFGRAEFVWGY